MPSGSAETWTFRETGGCQQPLRYGTSQSRTDSTIACVVTVVFGILLVVAVESHDVWYSSAETFHDLERHQRDELMRKLIPTTLLMFTCLVAVLYSMVSVPAINAVEAKAKVKTTSSQKDFKDFCEISKGRWIGEVIWITDWPGFGKKGDKVTAYTDFAVGEGGNVMTGRFYAGPGSGTILVHYDARTRQIWERAISSGGNVWNHLVYKHDGDWHVQTTGSTSDGKKISGHSIRSFTDKGKTQRWSGTWTIDGKKLDPLRDVFRRLDD